jgi:hypothetical protein
MARTSCRVRYGTGPEARGVWHDALTGAIGRCRCPARGWEGFRRRRPLGSREKGESTRSHFSRRKPSNWSVGGHFRGCLLLSMARITACPVLPGSVATTSYCCGRRRAGLDAPSEANGRLPRYERICKGILLADGAGLAELIQKRTSLGSALDQSGLLSWPIFCFCQRSS